MVFAIQGCRPAINDKPHSVKGKLRFVPQGQRRPTVHWMMLIDWVYALEAHLQQNPLGLLNRYSNRIALNMASTGLKQFERMIERQCIDIIERGRRIGEIKRFNFCQPRCRQIPSAPRTSPRWFGQPSRPYSCLLDSLRSSFEISISTGSDSTGLQESGRTNRSSAEIRCVLLMSPSPDVVGRFAHKAPVDCAWTLPRIQCYLKVVIQKWSEKTGQFFQRF